MNKPNIKLSKKTMTATIAILLILAFITPMFAIQSAKAQTPTGIKTYPFVEAIPNPVGVGQRTLINFGLLNFLQQDGDGWNVTLTITKPDGHTDTVGPLKTWSTGTVGYNFVPDQVGTYILQSHFAASWYNWSIVNFFGQHVASNDYMAASDSDNLTLVVQQEAVPSYPSAPLPTEYWSRPIDSQLREWYTIAGSWVAVPPNLYAPYNQGPESAHILWTRPLGDQAGGLAGGDTGTHGYEIGDAYEGKFASSVIISGVLYYNKYPSYFFSPSPQQTVVAVDLHTGKQLWEKTFLGNQRLAFGQVLYWDSINNRGAFSYLWVSFTSGFQTNWAAFDALSGDWKYNITNVPSGTNYYGPNGEILKYQTVNLGTTVNPNWRLLQWNSSFVVQSGKEGMSQSFGSQIQGVSYDAARGYDVNASITALPGSLITAFPGDRVIGGNVSNVGVTLWGLSLAKGSEGSLLFSNTWTAPTEWKDLTVTNSIGQAGWTAFSQTDKIAMYWTKENRVSYAFSLTTGKYLWETTPEAFQDAWSDTISLTFGPEKILAYGTYYSASLGGTVYAFNDTNGKLMWTYNATDPYHESYIANNWWLVPLFVTDGKLYVGHMEHSPLDPKPRGAPFICLNATDGSLIWKIDGAFRQTRWGGRAIIGDSIIATQDTYDQRVYAIGKGPSQTTISAPELAVQQGTTAVIRGSVMDISPGTQDDAVKLRFPNGVPAVSDDSQSDWMLYVYKQFQCPAKVTGIAVSIDATDPNGNSVHLGETFTDATGTFGFAWTPTTAGNYKITATFVGNKSYYGSYGQTYATVAQAPAATATPTPITQPPTEIYFAASTIIIVIAIAVATVLMLRKHP